MKVLCPNCIRAISSCKCPKGSLPFDFQAECRRSPPAWIVTAGFSQHGKTVYLAALTLMLEELGKVLPGCTLRYLDQYTADQIRMMRIKAAEGEVEGMTQRGKPSPLLMRLNTGFDVPSGYRSRTMIMFDASGEYFQQLEQLERRVPAITEVDVVWFLISISDLKESADQFTMSDLYQNYYMALRKAGKSMRGKNIIVILTKADELRDELPKDIYHYLANDPFKDSLTKKQDVIDDFSLGSYLESSEQISQRLEEFVSEQNIRGSHGFLTEARNEGANVRFCITSAQGHGDDAGKHVTQATRYRVLDPWFWTLWLSHNQGNSEVTDVLRNQTEQLHLVLDASADSEPIYQDQLPIQVWNAMSAREETNTYYLGDVSPVSHPGQEPPAAPPSRRRIRLLGPVLESMSENSKVVLLTNDKAIDQADFLHSIWRNQLLMVVTKDELEQMSWPNTYVMRPDDSPDNMINHLLNMSSDPDSSRVTSN